jgi:hypothetical protein
MIYLLMQIPPIYYVGFLYLNIIAAAAAWGYLQWKR